MGDEDMITRHALKIVFAKLIFVSLIGLLGGCSENSEVIERIELPQLSSERADAATMVLIGAPPVKPIDHINRWRASLQENNCLPCHATGSGGATILPDSHYFNDDPTEGVLRRYCIQCHVEQRDDRPAFNRDE